MWTISRLLFHNPGSDDLGNLAKNLGEILQDRERLYKTLFRPRSYQNYPDKILLRLPRKHKILARKTRKTLLKILFVETGDTREDPVSANETSADLGKVCYERSDRLQSCTFRQLKSLLLHAGLAPVLGKNSMADLLAASLTVSCLIDLPNLEKSSLVSERNQNSRNFPRNLPCMFFAAGFHVFPEKSLKAL